MVNDKINSKYSPKLDMLNPNNIYMDKYPDWTQIVEVNPNNVYMDKYPDWAQVAEVSSVMRDSILDKGKCRSR